MSVQTVKELMERLSQMDENAKVANILWFAEDVEGVAKENGETLTDDEVSEVMHRMVKYQDCEVGISWDTIKCHMNDVIRERPEDDCAGCENCTCGK